MYSAVQVATGPIIGLYTLIILADKICIISVPYVTIRFLKITNRPNVGTFSSYRRVNKYKYNMNCLHLYVSYVTCRKDQ